MSHAKLKPDATQGGNPPTVRERQSAGMVMDKGIVSGSGRGNGKDIVNENDIESNKDFVTQALALAWALAL